MKGWTRITGKGRDKTLPKHAKNNLYLLLSYEPIRHLILILASVWTVCYTKKMSRINPLLVCCKVMVHYQAYETERKDTYPEELHLYNEI